MERERERCGGEVERQRITGAGLCAYLCVYIGRCMCRGTDKLRHQPSGTIILKQDLEKRLLTENWGLRVILGYLASEPQGSARLCLPSVGMSRMHHHTQLLI